MNTFDKFSVLFQEDSIYTFKTAYPLGQITTDILNWDDAVIRDMVDRVETFDAAVRQMMTAPNAESMDDTQRKLNAVFDIARTFPPYRDLRMDWYSAYNLFPLLHEEDRERWELTMTDGTPAHQELLEFLRKITELPERLETFRAQIMLVLEEYFEELPQRNREGYASAFAEYYQAMVAGGQLIFSDAEFEQSFPAEIKFVPVVFRDQRDVPVLAEETQFDQLHAFLYADFYRGLMHGNAPRQCHNCGRYFLLTRGYNTCYCNNIAPGETERTCRQVGAHRVAAKLWAGDTPLTREYATTVNRIKGQRQSGKISREDFARFEDEAKELVDQVSRGELTDEEAIRKLDAISRFRGRRRKSG